MKPLLMVDCYQDGAQAAPNFLRYLPYETEVTRTVADPIPTDIGAYAGMVISGSSASVNDPPSWIPPLADLVEQATSKAVPVLGICFGHQLIAHVVMGAGAVQLAPMPEVGFLDIEITQQDPIFKGLPSTFKTFVSHGDEVVRGAPNITVLARSARCENHAFRVEGIPMWGVQFHSEMDRKEHEEILVGRSKRHPELHLDPALEMARHVDASPIARTLFGNFIAEMTKLRIS